MNSNKLNTRGIVAAAAFLIGGPLWVMAEGNNVGDKVFSIGPRVTYFNPQDAEDDSWYGGIQARAQLTPVLAVEGSIDYRKNRYENEVTVKGFPVQASLLAYILPQARLSPFLLGGAGWYYTRVSGPSVETNTDNRFGLHAGGGLEVMLTDSLSLDGSYRYIWLEDLSTHGANAIQKSYNDNSSMVTLALNILF